MASGVSESPSRVVHLIRAARNGAVGLARAAADLIVPPACLNCARSLADHDALCAACWNGILFIRPPLCDRLGIPLPFDAGGGAVSAAAAANPPAYGRARAVAAYDGVMRDLIHGFKYADRHDARRLFGRWMAEAGRDLLADTDLIVPVPLSRFRQVARRYNQAAILAHEVARASGRPVDCGLLLRVRRTRAQVGLTHEERRRNVASAFAIARGAHAQIEGRRIVLIDDVVTTGATVEACTRTLLKAGAARVDVLALALVAGESRLTA